MSDEAAVTQALAEVAAGRPVVVIDDEDRENEADLIVAADAMTPELTAFMVRHTSGVICAAMPGERLDRLGLPPMTHQNAEAMGTAFTVTVDAATDVTTGISAEDRTRTLRVLADPRSTADDLVRPGHVFPLRARNGGVLVRPGHTEAGVDLARLAGRSACAALAELVDEDGTMLRGTRVAEFARTHGLAVLRIRELIAYRQRTEQLLHRVSSARLPTPYGEFTAYGYGTRHDDHGGAQVALVYGEPRDGALVRLHSECLTGDVFGSLRCDCGQQLQAALAAVVEAGSGVVVYLRGHEGRGVGLLSKLAAYALQDDGHDTVDANLALGLPVDARDYWAGAQVLRDLGIGSVRLLTNNPAKRRGLEEYGIEVSACVPLVVPPGPYNAGYLRAKRERLGHLLPVGAEREEVTG